MLTRIGVARRLGKSIATVRRMEGIELHPTVDARGVHLFDEGAVDAIATPGTRGTRHRVGWDASGPRASHALHSVDPFFDSSAGLDDTAENTRRASANADVRVWAAQARHDALAIREERNRLEGLRREELAASAEAGRNLGVAKRLLIAELAECDERIIRRLTDSDRAEILALLEDEYPAHAASR